MKSIPFLGLLWVLASGLSACGPASTEDDQQVCATVIVYARPAAGGDCQSYGTPCDVPRGHVQCCGGLAYGGCLGQNVKCVDDPTDACNPGGSADCPGICQP